MQNKEEAEEALNFSKKSWSSADSMMAAYLLILETDFGNRWGIFWKGDIF